MTISITTEPVGANAHLRVWSGPEGSRALCGVLVMRPEEAAELTALVAAGQEALAIGGCEGCQCPLCCAPVGTHDGECPLAGLPEATP